MNNTYAGKLVLFSQVDQAIYVKKFSIKISGNSISFVRQSSAHIHIQQMNLDSFRTVIVRRVPTYRKDTWIDAIDRWR
jgi:hypothetical protein